MRAIIQNIISYSIAISLEDWVEDGCTAVGSACVGSFQEKSYLAGVRCCSDDGTICETPGRCPADNMNFDDATNKCNDLGKRLCTRDELLTGICCSTGGNCDISEVWTSPGRKNFISIL